MPQNWSLASLGAIAYANRQSGSHPVGDMIDGNDGTYYSSYDGPTTTVQIWFDLTANRLIGEIHIHQSSLATSAATAVNVYKSSNGVDWTLIANYACSVGPTTITIESTSARWFKIAPTVGGANNWVINSLELIGTDDPPPVVADVGSWITWLYNNGYQQAADQLEILSPGWEFQPHEIFIIAAAGQLTSMMAQILNGSSGGGLTASEMHTILGSSAVDTVVQNIHDFQTLWGAGHTAQMGEHADTQTALAVVEGNILAGAVVDKNAILAAIAALDGLTAADLAAMQSAIESRINTAQSAIIGDIDSKAAEVTAAVNGNVDAEHGTTRDLIGGIDELVNAVTAAAINGAVNGLTAEIDGAEAVILAALEALPQEAATDGRYPGPSGVTLSSPVSVSGPASIAGPMDGCHLTITATAPGTGRHEVGGFTNWLHGGYLFFVSTDGKADETQYLNLDSAVYVPKRIQRAGSVVIFPRAGTAYTVTPWDLLAGA